MKKITITFSLLAMFAGLTGCDKEGVDQDLSFLSTATTSNTGKIFDITNDNSGIVKITPTGEGVSSFVVNYGHGTGAGASAVVMPGNSTSHAYPEGSYTVTIVSSILLIIILIEGYKFYRLSPDKLYREKFTRFEQQKNSHDSSAISKAYNEKKYTAVIYLNRTSVLNSKDVFLTGMAYLELRDFSKAISSLQVVINETKNDESELKDAAEYYLALAYLQNQDYDQAIELMNRS